MTNIKKPVAQTPKTSVHHSRRPTSEINVCKSPSKVGKDKEKNQNE